MTINKNPGRQYYFKKSLGQNILRDLNIIKKIIASLDLKAGDVILEIGPGLGALTDELVKYDNEIVTIEKDTRFYEELKERYSQKNISILNADALKYDYSELFNKYDQKIKAVANLPYNVSTQILFKLFSLKEHFKSFLFMFQKEVADRITALPSTRDYGILSVVSQYHAIPSALIRVPSKCFVPAPKVDSTVVYFEIFDDPPHRVRDEELFVNVVKAAFSHRRKTLHNCFKSFRYDKGIEPDINRAFLKAGIEMNRRGETLTVEEFSRLTESFINICGESS